MRPDQPGAEQSDQPPAEKPANKKRKLLSRKAAAAALLAPQQATAEQSDVAAEHSGLACSSRSGRKTGHAPAEDNEADVEAAEAEASEPSRSRKSGHKRVRQVPTPYFGEPKVSSLSAGTVMFRAALPMGYLAAQAGLMCALILKWSYCQTSRECCMQSVQSPAARKHLTWGQKCDNTTQQRMTVQAAEVAASEAPPEVDARPSSAKRIFIALSGLHTNETVRYKELLRDLGINHTSGLEKHL